MTRGGRVTPLRVGRPKASPAASVAAPHALCPLCQDAGKACLFHRAGGPSESVRALAASLKKESVVGLADFFEAGSAALTDLPSPVLDVVADCDPEAASTELGVLLEMDGFDAPALRRMAALCLALAVHDEAQGNDGDDDAEVSDDG